jgi:phosphatidylserine/phosphatidylglycerophosphate/cardiolipin synthase-like enzyme
MPRLFHSVTFAVVVILLAPAWAAAQERLCDTQFETDCRSQIINLINREPTSGGINVAFWFMEDARYVTALVAAHNRGVPIRILVDERANTSKRLNAQTLASLRAAGIPMREKLPDLTYSIEILHFKMMQFLGQGMLEFSKANYSDPEFVPIVPNVNYSDEAVFFTDDARLTGSFRRRFDDLWVDTTVYRNYANIAGPLVRECPTTVCVIDPSMNFPPLKDFAVRAKSRIDAEPAGGQIDAFVYRATDHLLPDAVIAAVKRGVTVRLVSDPTEYRNNTRQWDAAHMDRMWMNGVHLKMGTHGGNAHQASIVLHRLGEVIFGSSNWTTPSAIKQDEHNFFYSPGLNKPWFFQWFVDQFNRRWNDATNYPAFVPLPPDSPVYASPVNASSGTGTSVTLKWEGGPWAHFYDIYFGTSSNPPLLAGNLQIGSPDPGQGEKYTVSNLATGTTYYWRIVSRTWAQKTKAGAVWSFNTAGTPPIIGGSYTGTPYPSTAAAIPGVVQAENFDHGGQGVSYSDTTTANTGGAYRSTGVDLQATADAGGGFNLGWTRPGEWLKYTVNVATTRTYQLTARVANAAGGATFRIEVDGVDRTGAITVPNTGGWQTWQTISKSGVALSAGRHVLRVVFLSGTSTGDAGNYNWFQFQ